MIKKLIQPTVLNDVSCELPLIVQMRLLERLVDQISQLFFLPAIVQSLIVA